MPKYKTHLAGGFITFLVVLIIWSSIQSLKFGSNFHISHLFLYLGSCLLGSLFPDIDTKSLIQKYVYFFTFFVIVITILLKQWMLASFLGVIAFIPILVNHRKLTHRKWFVVVIPLSVPILTFHYNQALIYPVFTAYLFFLAGAFSHLLLDFGPKRFLKSKF